MRPSLLTLIAAVVAAESAPPDTAEILVSVAGMVAGAAVGIGLLYIVYRLVQRRRDDPRGPHPR